MNGEGRVFVVTCRLPRGLEKSLEVSVAGHAVTISSADGFRHTLELPADALADELEWQVYAGVLEVRAPYAVAR